MASNKIENKIPKVVKIEITEAAINIYFILLSCSFIIAFFSVNIKVDFFLNFN